MGRGGRARGALWRGGRRGAGELREDRIHRGFAGVLALRSGRTVRAGDAVPAEGRRGAPPHAQGGSMNAAQVWARKLSGRSQSAKPPPPPRSGDILTEHGPNAGPDASRGVILYLEDITVSFDGFRALNALTLYIDSGELRCIIGPNGAGKTTMMDVITGKTRPDAGSAWFGQTLDLLSLNEPEIARAGIGRKFQKPTVFGEHSVYENLQLAAAGDKSPWATLFKPLSGEQRD